MKTLSQKRECLYLMIIYLDLVHEYLNSSFISIEIRYSVKKQEPKGMLLEAYLPLSSKRQQFTRSDAQRSDTLSREGGEGGVLGGV